MREAEQGAPANVRSQVQATTRTPAPPRAATVASGSAPPVRITRRALLLGALAIFANAAWVAYMEPIKAAGRTTIFSLFFASVFTLLLLVAVNAGLRRAWPRVAFSQAELLTVYVMTNFGVALIGVDMLQVLVPMMASPVYLATPANKWQLLFVDRLPGWLVVKDYDTARAMFVGGESFWQGRYLAHWAVPIAAWTGFVMLLLGTMLCLNNLLRRQWSEREKLSFPLVSVALQITDPSGALFRSRLTWLGFALPCILNTVNSLYVLMPSIPEIPIAARPVTRHLVDPPWSALGLTFVSFYPWAVGLGYLLPVDLLFSGVFFYWVWKLERVLSVAYGWGTDRPNAPYIEEQALGGYLGICLLALWFARRHLGLALRTALRLGRGAAGARMDAGEAFSYRASFLGLGAGLAALMLFATAMGMSPGVAAIYLGVYLAVSITITRIRSEFGAPVHDLHFADAGKMMVNAMGSAHLRTGDLVGFGLFFWFNRAYRSHPMGLQLEGLKFAERERIPGGAMAAVMLLAGFLGMLAGFWALLTPYYRLGIDTADVLGNPRGFGRQSYARLAAWLESPTPPDPLSPDFIAVGAGVVVLLSWIRTHWVGFPLHPVAFAVSSSWNMNLLWVPLGLAWIFKALTLRYGGLRLYRALVPFFFGLMLGDFVSLTLWNLAAVLGDFPGYRLFYN